MPIYTRSAADFSCQRHFALHVFLKSSTVSATASSQSGYAGYPSVPLFSLALLDYLDSLAVSLADDVYISRLHIISLHTVYGVYACNV